MKSLVINSEFDLVFPSYVEVIGEPIYFKDSLSNLTKEELEELELENTNPCPQYLVEISNEDFPRFIKWIEENKNIYDYWED